MNTTTVPAAAMIMPVIALGKKTMPILFVLSMTGAMASRTERRMTSAALCRGEAPSARAASIWARRSPASCTRRTAVTEATLSPAQMPTACSLADEHAGEGERHGNHGLIGQVTRADHRPHRGQDGRRSTSAWGDWQRHRRPVVVIWSPRTLHSLGPCAAGAPTCTPVR